jgi:hypothetical protein
MVSSTGRDRSIAANGAELGQPRRKSHWWGLPYLAFTLLGEYTHFSL